MGRLIRSVGLGLLVAVVLVLVVWTIPSLLVRQPKVNGPDRHKAIADVRTGLIALLGALGAAGGLAYTAKTFRLGHTAQLTGRFQKASKQMGHEHPIVRVAGIHAMAQLADEWPPQRQRCIDVLCAYLRFYGAPTSAKPDLYREARRTTVDVISERLSAGSGHAGWEGCDFDLTGAVLDVGDFSGVFFSKGEFRFEEVQFTGDVKFDNAQFTGATVSFNRATFKDTCRVTFNSAEFRSGRVNFDNATFQNGEVYFSGAQFKPGCRVTFDQALLGGSVFFEKAVFEGPKVSFSGARFPEGDGKVSFKAAVFKGHISFDKAEFHRDVSFSGCDVRQAEFSFRRTKLTKGQLSFDKAQGVGGTFLVDSAETQEVGFGSFNLSTAMSKPKFVVASADDPLTEEGPRWR